MVEAVYLCGSCVPRCGQSTVWRRGGQQDLQHLAAHVQLGKHLPQTLCIHYDLVHYIGTAEIKVQNLIGILCLDTAVCHHTRLLKTTGVDR